MTGNTPRLEAFARDSQLYESYTTAASATLSMDAELRAARDEWIRFFTDSHGAIFDDCDADEARKRLFLDVLYYDFVVDRLMNAVGHEYDVELVNPEATDNTDALSFEFRSLHDAVVADTVIESELDSPLDAFDPTAVDSAFLRKLYQNVVSPDVRRPLGEYYTPWGLAELGVAALEITDFETETILDPGCGSGVFLAASIDAKRDALAETLDADALLEAITKTVLGIDLNPVAVKSAKLRYLLALAPLLADSDLDRLELPVFLTDALGLTRDDPLRFGGNDLDLTVDHLVGNPPWVTWGELSESVRDAWRDADANQLDLLAHEGVERRLGHANDDISVPFVHVCVHRYLAKGGDASLVLKRGLTKGPAGRSFRRRRVGDRTLAIEHVHDFNDLSPFGNGVNVRAAIYRIRADDESSFPIPVDSWTREGKRVRFSSAETMRSSATYERTGLVPVVEDDPASSWVRVDAERRALGECAHDIRHGVKDDAKAVYSVDRDQLDALEPDQVFPYLRSRHVVKYGLFGHDLHLIPMRTANEDNEADLQTRCPKTYEYLCANRDTLESRSSTWLESGPFYTLFGLGEYTWSAYKVVWCRLGFKPHFAVVSTVDDEDLGEKPVVPGDHCMFISTDNRYEAHFLCALLNSAPYQRCLEGISSGGKSSLTKAVISDLSLPAYRGTKRGQRLAELSMAAHEIVPGFTDVSKREYNRTEIPELDAVQAEIDERVETMLSGTTSHD